MEEIQVYIGFLPLNISMLKELTEQWGKLSLGVLDNIPQQALASMSLGFAVSERRVGS